MNAKEAKKRSDELKNGESLSHFLNLKIKSTQKQLPVFDVNGVKPKIFNRVSLALSCIRNRSCL